MTPKIFSIVFPLLFVIACFGLLWLASRLISKKQPPSNSNDNSQPVVPLPDDESVIPEPFSVVDKAHHLSDPIHELYNPLPTMAEQESCGIFVPRFEPLSLALLAESSDCDIDITDEHMAVLHAFDEGKNIYVTGKAGTGKSTLLKFIVSSSEKEIVVLAPTGVAAVNIGGETIHSFFNLPFKYTDPKKLSVPGRHELIRIIDTIIIDEASMVSSYMLDCLNVCLKKTLRNQLPFGGIQVVLFGDLHQLPPVLPGYLLAKTLRDYGGKFFFNATDFSLCAFHYFELNKIYRQKDLEFIKVLNEIREKNEILRVLEILNQQVVSRKEIMCSPDKYVTLTARRDVAAEINKMELARLEGQLHTYVAEIQKSGSGKSVFDDDEVLQLKKGAEVMFTNNDSAKRWVNGTVGVVEECNNNEIIVRINNVCHLVDREKKEVLKYSYDRKKNKIKTRVAEVFLQYPLRLAYAMTIHKSQGKTFDRVFIDLGSGAFDHGQVYVALSRCTSLEGVRLCKPLTPKDIIFDEQIFACRERYFH